MKKVNERKINHWIVFRLWPNPHPYPHRGDFLPIAVLEEERAISLGLNRAREKTNIYFRKASEKLFLEWRNLINGERVDIPVYRRSMADGEYYYYCAEAETPAHGISYGNE